LGKIKIKKFIESILKNTIEYDDEFYKKLEIMATDCECQKELINSLINIEKEINSENVNYILSIVDELIFCYNINLNELYPMFLNIMFCDYSLDYSLCFRFAKVLIGMKNGDEEDVFKDILNQIKSKQLTKIRIAVCSLYGNFDFDTIEKKLLNIFLQEIMVLLNYYKENMAFKNDVKYFLIPKIQNSKFNIYYEEISSII